MRHLGGLWDKSDKQCDGGDKKEEGEEMCCKHLSTVASHLKSIQKAASVGKKKSLPATAFSLDMGPWGHKTIWLRPYSGHLRKDKVPKLLDVNVLPSGDVLPLPFHIRSIRAELVLLWVTLQIIHPGCRPLRWAALFARCLCRLSTPDGGRSGAGIWFPFAWSVWIVGPQLKVNAGVVLLTYIYTHTHIRPSVMWKIRPI